MKHKMHLNNGQFILMKKGMKTIELRLNDEKRELLKVNDLIEFTNEKTEETLDTKIVALHKYPNFEELYKHFDKIALGYDKSDLVDPKDMEKYYSLSEHEKYGVVGIEIKLLDIKK